MTQEPPPMAFASHDDICAAYEGLTDIELARLFKAAAYSMLGSEYTDPLELVGEAMARTMSGVGSAAGRHWPKNVPFMAFMTNTIRSIANASRQSLAQRATDRFEAHVGEDGDSDLFLSRAGHARPDVLEQVMEAQEAVAWQEKAMADAALIEDHFAGDENIMWIIEGHKEGWSAKTVREESGMDQTTYDSALRRLRRGVDKLMPSGRTA